MISFHTVRYFKMELLLLKNLGIDTLASKIHSLQIPCATKDLERCYEMYAV